MHAAGHGEGALRRKRVSNVGASYFVTLCTADRQCGITTPTIATDIWAEVSAIESDGHWVFRAGVIMPDHVHLLVQLGETLTISRTIARLKAKTKRALESISAKWQPNFYEHRLRPDDLVENVVRYIFLNPYRTRLVGERETYRWFKLGAQEAEWFMPDTEKGAPFPEWLR